MAGLYLGTPSNLGYGQSPGFSSTPVQPLPSNVIGPQAVQSNAANSNYDPAYLQNLATYIGGLFARPNGNLSFNPLGNLSDVQSPQQGIGNAALPGSPNTLLANALGGLGFQVYNPNAPVATSSTSSSTPTGTVVGGVSSTNILGQVPSTA